MLVKKENRNLESIMIGAQVESNSKNAKIRDMSTACVNRHFKKVPLYHKEEVTDSNNNEHVENIRTLISRASEEIIYSETASYLAARVEIILYVEEICKNFNYGLRTYYLAIYLVDRLLSRNNAKKPELDLICLITVNIAAKQHETRYRLPKFADLVEAFSGKYDISTVRDYEITVLRLLNFRIYAVTVYDIVLNFIEIGHISNDNSNRKLNQKNNSIIRKLKNVASMFVELTVNEYVFYMFPVTVLAASCLINATRMLGVESLWAPHIKWLFNENSCQIECCAELLESFTLRVSNQIKRKKHFKDTQKIDDQSKQLFSHLAQLQCKRNSNLGSVHKMSSHKELRSIFSQKYVTYRDLSVLGESKVTK